MTMSRTESKTELRIPVWLSISVVIGALLMATGGIVALVRPAMLVSPDAEIGRAAHVYAGYLVSRNMALAVMLLVALKVRAAVPLSCLMVLTALIQIIDAGMDSIEGRWAVVPGVLIYGIVFLVGAAQLSGQPFWKVAAWRHQG